MRHLYVNPKGNLTVPAFWPTHGCSLSRPEDARMAYAEYSNQGAKAKELRKKAGRYIRSLREAAGLTQNDLSKALGLDYYTFISQVETGMTRVPPDKYRLWATALKVEVEEFTRTLLSFYDPFTYDALFTKKKEKRDVE